MTVIAKMICNDIEDFGYSKRLSFGCVYEQSGEGTPEDQRFTKATPWGEAKMTVDNPAAVEQFSKGEPYYVLFVPAKDGVPQVTQPGG
jgi:hypothetical protein